MSKTKYLDNLTKAISGVYPKDERNEIYHNAITETALPEIFKVLTLDEQRLIELIHRDGLSLKECSRHFDATPGALRHRHQRALYKARIKVNYMTIHGIPGETFIGDLVLSTSTHRALTYNGIRTIERAQAMTENELKQNRNFGEKEYKELTEKLNNYKQ